MIMMGSAALLAALRALDIAEVTYSLSGCGDEGTTTLEAITKRDGTELSALPHVAIGFYTAASFIADALEYYVSELPEGNWVDGPGGDGTIVVRPFDEDDPFDVSMTYHDDDFHDEAPDYDDDLPSIACPIDTITIEGLRDVG